MVCSASLFVYSDTHFGPSWFLEITFTMSDDEAHCSVLLVTHKACQDTYVSRQQAYDWAKGLIRDICQSAGANFDGQLKAAIPLKSVITGFLYKLVFQDVPEELICSTVIPGMEAR